MTDINEQVSPMVKQYMQAFEKMSERVMNDPNEMERLLNAHPKGMAQYSLEDLGFVIGKIEGTADDEKIKQDILDLPIIKDHMIADKFQDVEKCRGANFLLMYLSNLQEKREEETLQKLYLANGVTSLKDLFYNAMLSNEIIFFSFLKEFDVENEIEIPDFKMLDPTAYNSLFKKVATQFPI